MDAHKKTRLSRPIVAAVLLLAVLLVALALRERSLRSPQSAAPAAATTELFAMDTVMHLTAFGDGAETALKTARAELLRLDALWSVTSATSELAELNIAKALTVSTETMSILETAERVRALSDGAFNIAIRPAVLAWGFTTDEPRIPAPQELSVLRETVSATRLTLDGDTVTLLGDADCALDFGAIAKGAAAQRVIDLLRESGIESAIVQLGGNVQTLGTKPNGEPWSIGVQDPRDPAALVGTLKLADVAAVTSGGYQRFFERDGELYHHILDPKTCAPAASGLISATIVTPDGTLADALSTATFVLGLDGATALWRSGELDFDMLLIAADGTIYVTAPLADAFTPRDGERVVVIE